MVAAPLEADLVAAAVGVVDGDSGGGGERPLVPHVLRRDVAPEVQHHLQARE